MCVCVYAYIQTHSHTLTNLHLHLHIYTDILTTGGLDIGELGSQCVSCAGGTGLIQADHAERVAHGHLVSVRFTGVEGQVDDGDVVAVGQANLRVGRHRFVLGVVWGWLWDLGVYRVEGLLCACSGGGWVMGVRGIGSREVMGLFWVWCGMVMGVRE